MEIAHFICMTVIDLVMAVPCVITSNIDNCCVICVPIWILNDVNMYLSIMNTQQIYQILSILLIDFWKMPIYIISNSNQFIIQCPCCLSKNTANSVSIAAPAIDNRFIMKSITNHPMSTSK